MIQIQTELNVADNTGDSCSKKLGHPQPDSYLVELLKSSFSQHLHLKIPPLIILKFFPEKGGSVPFCLVI